jgi:hypothetical protein
MFLLLLLYVIYGNVIIKNTYHKGKKVDYVLPTDTHKCFCNGCGPNSLENWNG